jgi:hypothetical protein
MEKDEGWESFCISIAYSHPLRFTNVNGVMKFEWLGTQEGPIDCFELPDPKTEFQVTLCHPSGQWIVEPVPHSTYFKPRVSSNQGRTWHEVE